MPRRLILAALACAALIAPAALAAPAGDIAAAVADTSRPEGDVKRDADRKPAELLSFAGVKAGQTIVDLIPGGGYFTRLFSKAAGPKGTVYAVSPPPQPPAEGKPAKPDAIAALTADPGYANVKAVTLGPSGFVLPTQADVLWTSQNYHDLHLARLKLDVPATNKAIFAALKPGGLYIVLDHAAAAGAPLEVADTLHRIDPAIVRKEVEAAGFKYEGESAILRNPADDHSKIVFDPAVRGHTDQFVYKFRKPK